MKDKHNQQVAIDIIKQLSGQANILTIPRVYVDFMGSLDGALLLSQIIYWSDRTKDPEGWFYKTYEEWTAEITLSKYEVSKQAKKMKSMGFLETRIKKADGSPTVHYRLNWTTFLQTFVKFLHEPKYSNSTNDDAESERSLTETTPETTTETPEVADYLQSLVSFVPGKESIAEPDAFQKYFGYRDQVLALFAAEFGPPNQGRKGELADLGADARFNLEVYTAYVHQYNINGGNPYDVQKFINGYWEYLQTKDIRRALWGNKSNGDSTGKTTRTADGGYYV